MTNTIPPFRQPSLPDAAGSPAATSQSPSPAPAQAADAPPQTDQVTLSAAAQSGAEMLAAAQGASGIDKAAVAAIRAQLANGSYNVSPENLAQAMAAVLKETK